jgi:hypothetical protein
VASGSKQIGKAETAAQQLFGAVDDAFRAGEISAADRRALSQDAANKALDITDILGTEIIE